MERRTGPACTWCCSPLGGIQCVFCDNNCPFCVHPNNGFDHTVNHLANDLKHRSRVLSRLFRGQGRPICGHSLRPRAHGFMLNAKGGKDGPLPLFENSY